MRIRKLISLLVCVLLMAGALTGCGQKYENSEEFINDVRTFVEGSFSVNAEFTVKNAEAEVTTTFKLNGVTDGMVAVCDYFTSFTCDGESEVVKEPVVYISDTSQILGNYHGALKTAFGEEWEYNDGVYSGGSDENKTIDSFFVYLSGALTGAGAEEAGKHMQESIYGYDWDDREAVMNTSASLEDGEFSETITGSIVTPEKSLDFKLTCSFIEEEISYESDSEYITMETALLESFNDIYKVKGAEYGLYEAEEVEISAHVVDGSSLIFEGFDGKFYKMHWDGTVMSYSSGDFEMGNWSLCLGTDNMTSVGFKQFDGNEETLLEWYKSTYSDEMKAEISSESVETGIGTMTCAKVKLTYEELEMDIDMYLYQVSDTCQLQLTVQNSSEKYTDLELIDLALKACEEYKGGE